VTQLATDPEVPAAAVAEDVRRAERTDRIVGVVQRQGALAVLVIVVIIASIAWPNFRSYDNAATMLVAAAPPLLIALGMTFVIINGGIDLSVGSVLVLSGVIASKVMVAAGGQGWGVALLGIGVASACGLACGLLNGVLIARLKVPPLIVTLGTMGATLGIAQIITDGIDLRDAPDVLVDNIGFGNLVGQVPTLSVIALVVVLLGMVVLHRTRFGLHTYAIGSNPEAGRRVGLKVDRHLIKVYALAGLTAGFAGILNLAFFQSTTIAGQTNTNLNVIAGVVIGGTSLFGGVGSMAGTATGVLIIATIANGMVLLNVPDFWQQIVVGWIIVAAVMLDQLAKSARLPAFLR
jgi:ribose transport system permease protein